MGKHLFRVQHSRTHEAAKVGIKASTAWTQPTQQTVLRADSRWLSRRTKQIGVGLGRSNEDVQVRDAYEQTDEAYENEADEEGPGGRAAEVTLDCLPAPETPRDQAREQCDTCEMHLGLIHIHSTHHARNLREHCETVKPKRDHKRSVE